MKNKKMALLHSVIALLLCVSMLVGSTFAWFTDSVKTGINTIAAGVLDVDSRMELWFSGLGRVRFEFTGGSDTVAISRMIARYALA